MLVGVDDDVLGGSTTVLLMFLMSFLVSADCCPWLLLQNIRGLFSISSDEPPEYDMFKEMEF